MRVREITAAVLLTGCLYGCRARHAATDAADPPKATTQKLSASATTANTRPTDGAATRAASKTFEDRPHGFSVAYPAGWSLRNDPENCFTADARPNDETGPELCVAVPSLPPHVPGMVPLGPVQSGYIDDLRKRLRDVKVEPRPTGDVPIPGAHLRRFDASGKGDKGERVLNVLIVYKGDRLYIMTAEAPAAEAATARAAFEQAVASWKWIGSGR